MQLTLRKRWQQRLPVRLELHAGPRQGPRLAGRARQRLRQLRHRRLLRLPRSTRSSRTSSTGNADFDVRHQINVNWLAELPFGQGKRLGRRRRAVTNAIIGDWSVAGIGRWTSGFPFNVNNCRSCWATNWNLQGNAALVDPACCPRRRRRKNAVGGRRARSPIRGGADVLPERDPGRGRHPQPAARRRLLHAST